MNCKLVIAALLIGLITNTACNNRTSEDHAHAADGSHPGEEELQTLSYTLYTAKSELFVEFKPPVVGTTSTFAAHLTRLGENFLPYKEGSVTLSLVIDGEGIRQTATAPSSPGIFRLALQPGKAGVGKLSFDIQSNGFTDQFVIDSVLVYPDQKTAMAAQPKDPGGADISFLKEQAWKIEFANAPVVKETIFDILKTTGEIQSAPGDEITIAAKSNGLVRFAGSSWVIGSAVRSGQTLFTVTGGEIAFENVEAAKQSARAELSTAKAEYERASELIKDKLIVQSEFKQAELRYEQAQISVANLNRNYNGSKVLTSPINGFVKSLLVAEGQYVTTGHPLAVVTRNQRYVLKADVSLKDADKIASIQHANFTVVQSKEKFDTRELNGRLMATGKTTAGNTPFIPVYFQIDSRPGMLSGSFAEVYLKTVPIPNALVIPVTALLEEQGGFYAYVQMEGESFQKRELKLGANDGIKVQVLSGVAEGERVVVKGAYQIKLTQASGALPAHGHEH